MKNKHLGDLYPFPLQCHAQLQTRYQLTGKLLARHLTQFLPWKVRESGTYFDAFAARAKRRKTE